MSADKFQSIREALADAFNAENPISTNTQSSHATFDHTAFSDAFSTPHHNEAAANGSPARVDHASLTGMFRKPPEEVQTAFDEEFADVLSKPPPLVTDAQTPPPGFDHQGVAEILSEPPAISVNIRPSQPCFDHQVLVEILTEARADPIDPPSSRLGFAEPSSVASLSSDVEQGEPTAQSFANSPLADTAEDTRPPRARSLLAKLHQIFSTKEQPVPSDAQKDGSSKVSSVPDSSPLTIETQSSLREPPLPDPPPALAPKSQPSRTSLADQPATPTPADEIARGVVAASSGNARPQPPRSLPEERSLLPEIESPPADPQASSPGLSDRSTDMLPASGAAERGPPIEVEDTRPQRLQRLLAELSPTTVAKSGLSPETSREETPRLTSSTPVESLEPSATSLALRPGTETESAAMRLPETPRWPSAIIKTDSTNADSQSFVFQNETAPVDSGHATPQEPAKADATAAVADAKSGRLPGTELPRSPIPESTALHATPDREQPIVEQHLTPPPLPDQPDGIAPLAKPAMETPPTEAEGTSPQIAGSLLAALHVLNAKPSPPAVEKEPVRTIPARRPDDAGNPAAAANQPTAAEDALARPHKSLLTEIAVTDSTDAKPAALASMNEPSNSPVSGGATNTATTADAVAVAASIDTESAVARAQQAKALLSGLDLRTAIHLRWVMRDIRSRRTKLAPVSAKDLAALVDLGFVELREDLPRLTGLGILALD